MFERGDLVANLMRSSMGEVGFYIRDISVWEVAIDRVPKAPPDNIKTKCTRDENPEPLDLSGGGHFIRKMHIHHHIFFFSPLRGSGKNSPAFDSSNSP